MKRALLLILLTVPVRPQAPPLQVVSAGPNGELTELADAGEVRVVFSQPMLAIGDAAVTGAPSWIKISPPAKGTFYWSGTRTLIFTPDPAAPLPFATQYTVSIGSAATSVAGNALRGAYEFTFTTPTVRLLAADWYRKTGRSDSPVVIALRFNQPVRPADVARHLQVRPGTHAWTAPALSPDARSRLAARDPAGLARYDAKVAATARVAAGRGDPVAAAPAVSWNDARFPPAASVAVLETTSAPPPESWLVLTLDDRLPSLEGPATHAAQSTTIRLEPAFFVDVLNCRAECDPSSYHALTFRRPISLEAFTRVLAVRDITDAGRERPIAASGPPSTRLGTFASQRFSIEDAGFARQPPASTWLFAIDGSLESSDGQTLGYPWLDSVENLHEQPFAAFDGSVWEASGGPSVPVVSRNVTSLTQWATPFTSGDLVYRLREMVRANGDVVPMVASTTRRLTAAPDAVEGHAIDLRDLLSPQGKGIVWAAIKFGDTIPRVFWPNYAGAGTRVETRAALVQVTNLGVSVKDSPQSTLVFVTTLDTGTPVADAAVAIAMNGDTVMWRGSTGRDGVAIAPALALRPGTERLPSFVVTAEKDGDRAFVASDWNAGIQPFSWSLNYQPAESTDILRGSIFTDRGVYRQGEEIRVKAVLRFDTPSGIALATADSTFDALVRDAPGREIDKRTVVVNRWSSAEWTWRVPADGALGRYTIELRAPAGPSDTPATARFRQATGSFLVAQYRRPDFRVDATLAGEPPIAGASVRGAVEAKYLFGAGVAAQPVRWTLTRTPTQNVPLAIRQRFPEERYAFGYLATPPPNTPATVQVATKNDTLDAGGRLAVDLPTDGAGDAAYSYTFEGDVESASGQHIANRAALVVHPASFYVGLRRPPFFVDSKVGASTEVAAVALDGRAVAGVPVTVSLWRVEWQWQPRPAYAGPAAWERKEVAAGEWTVTSTDRPEPMQIPVRDGGSYVLRAASRDQNGRRTRTEVSFYASGSGRTIWKTDGNRIDLVPERKTWKPGESARILIQSPWERATALLTVEREGIRSHRTFNVTSTQDTIEVPITETDVPNVYVSVILVKGRTADELGPDGSDLGKPSYRVGYTELTVDDAAKRLEVQVSADREEYRPRQPIKVDVAVTTPQGRPALGEVTLWAVDYGLLSLTDYRTPDVLKAIYARKALQVMTEENRQRLISRRVLAADRSADQSSSARSLSESVQGFAGGGGGGGRGGGVARGLVGGIAPPPAAAMPPPPPGQAIDIRTDFRPLVFWLGSTVTGADGRATATVTLPDSLTTYRIMAVAGDASSHFGWAEREVRVTKLLTLLPAFPRFLSRGDRAAFGAVVTNAGTDAGDAVVTMRSLDPDVLAFGGAASQTLRLARGATAPVRFDATARGAGTARVQMTVTLGGETDAFETTLPVTVPARLETVAAYGETMAEALEKVVLPPGLVPSVGGLRVELASTALVGLGESARYLDEYPYDCAEQKASRAMALILASDLGGAFNLADIKPADTRAAATATLNDLYSYQCGDGGFALWPGRCQSTSAYLTAYVLHAFKVAGTLGVIVDQNAVDRALGYLQGQLRQAPPEIQWWPVWAASQAFAVKVLAEFNRNPNADIARLYGMAERMPIFALSYLADAMAATGDRGARYQDVVRRLGNALRIDADRAHVEEIDDAALVWLWNSNVRATAVVLDGLARRRDDATFVAPLVRWLVASRTNGRWGTTHENATALEALVAYYRAYEAEVPDMIATVKLGGATVGSATFKGRSTTSQSLQLSMADVVREVATATSRDLIVSRAGTGRVYYTSRLQYLAPESPEPVDRGIRVERRYERYVANEPGVAATTFGADDLVRVTLTLVLPREGRYLALTDLIPAGFEPVDANLRTTATDLGRQATTSDTSGNWLAQWRRGGFDHVEKHDDRVVAFATRLAAGRHEISYLVRATTSGTFTAPGAQAEAMYAPEVKGRSAAAVVQIR